MKACLLDASAWLAALDRDDRFHETARALIRSDRLDHAALDLTLYEVANVAGRAWGESAMAQRVFRLVMAASGHRLVRVDEALADAAIEISAEHEITVYDAAYVAAARRQDWDLISTDLRDLVRRGLALAPDSVG